MNEDFDPSSERNYFSYSIEATSIVEHSPLIQAADVHVPGMFQYESDTVQCNNYYVHGEAEAEDTDDDSDIELYEDDLCVGVRRRAMYQPNKFGHRHKKLKDCIYGSVLNETNESEEDDGLREFLTNARLNIASLNLFSDEDLRTGAYQWFKDKISVHFIHHKWKILAFSVVWIVIVVYFAIGNPSKEEAGIPLANEREPTASPTTIEYYTGADLLATQSFRRTSLSEVLSEDEMVLFESIIENWLSYENVYSDSYSNETVVTKCSIMSQTVQNSSSNRKYNIRRKLDASITNGTSETVYILYIEYMVSYVIRSEQNFDNIEKLVNTLMEDSDSKDELAIMLERADIYIDANGVGKGVGFLLENIIATTSPPIGKNFSALILSIKLYLK